MDGLAPIGARGQLVTPRPPDAKGPDDADTKPAKGGFAVEAATIEISAKLSYVRLIGGTSGGEVVLPNGDHATEEELLQKLKDFVRNLFEKNGIEFKDMTAEEAQQKIAAGGDQSPEAVSKRILDVVAGFANGSPEREKLLRDAVEEGFKEAEGAWGGKLPDISYKTMGLVRAGLDKLFANKPEDGGKDDHPKVDMAA